MARQSKTDEINWRTNLDTEGYSSAWLRLNRPFVTQAMQRMPRLPVEDPWVHVCGAGPGDELAKLMLNYPRARVVTSDITTLFTDPLHKILEKLKLPDRFLLADAGAPPVEGVDISASFFVMHLAADPPALLQAQWKSLKPGGWFAAMYFPPVPTGEGPLSAYYRAVNDVLGGRSKPNWEQVVLPWLTARASRLTSRLIYSQWSFSEHDAFRAAMELLPDINRLRATLGEERYKTTWTRWRGSPGLIADMADGYHGAVGARFLLAQRPGSR